MPKRSDTSRPPVASALAANTNGLTDAEVARRLGVRRNFLQKDLSSTKSETTGRENTKKRGLRSSPAKAPADFDKRILEAAHEYAAAQAVLYGKPPVSADDALKIHLGRERLLDIVAELALEKAGLKPKDRGRKNKSQRLSNTSPDM
jgi:hypothetical protein